MHFPLKPASIQLENLGRFHFILKNSVNIWDMYIASWIGVLGEGVAGGNQTGHVQYFGWRYIFFLSNVSNTANVAWNVAKEANLIPTESIHSLKSSG